MLPPNKTQNLKKFKNKANQDSLQSTLIMKTSNFRIIPIVIGLLLCQVQACKSSNKKGWYVKINKAEYEAKVKELEAAKTKEK